MNKVIKYDAIGVFKEELTNRFMSNVMIDGKEEICYVKSSSRLENYLIMNNKKVYLKNNKNSKFQYYVYGVKHKNSCILLCPSLANDIVYDSIHKKMFSFLGIRSKIEKEHKISNYTSDLFLPKNNIFIEIKSIISESTEATFPLVYSERLDKQLAEINDILIKNKVYLFLVCFNPYTTLIRINKDNKNYERIIESIKKGLIVKGFVIDYEKGEPIIKKEITILFD